MISCSAQIPPTHYRQRFCVFFCILNAYLLSYIDSQNVYIRGRAWPHNTSHLRPTDSSNVGFSAGYPLFFRRFWHFTTPKVIVLDTNFAILTQKTRPWQRLSWDFRRKIRNLMTSQSLPRRLISTPETTFYHGQTGLVVTQKFQVKTPHRIWATHGFDWMHPSGEATQLRKCWTCNRNDTIVLFFNII
jgi:hypothetical protein